MKVLITGGTGFLGKHLVKQLEIEHQVIAPPSKAFNLLDPNVRLSSIWLEKPDAVLHMAAKCGGILKNKNSPADFIRDNTQMALNIYECVRFHKIPFIYSLGSVCMYPKYTQVPFREDDIWKNYPEETNAPYGISKRTLMMLGQTYREQYGIKGAHLIPTNLYGEHDHFDLTNSHVIPALIRKFDTAMTNNLPTVECWGSGTGATREFLNAHDAAEAITKAITMRLDTELPINLGTGKETSIYKLAYLIKELTGYQGDVVFTGEVSDGQPRRCLDVSRAKAFINWEASIDLRAGLLKTIEWYRANKHLIAD